MAAVVQDLEGKVDAGLVADHQHSTKGSLAGGAENGEVGHGLGRDIHERYCMGWEGGTSNESVGCARGCVLASLQRELGGKIRGLAVNGSVCCAWCIG